MRPQVPDGQLDPVDLELRDVQEHVDVLAGGGLIRNAVVGWRCILAHGMCLLAVHGPPGAVRLPSKEHDTPLSAAPRQLLRITLPRTPVNKGKMEGRGFSRPHSS